MARTPPAGSTGLICYPRSFSALGAQRAEILPVQRPPALVVGAHCMTQITRILTGKLVEVQILKIVRHFLFERGTFFGIPVEAQ